MSRKPATCGPPNAFTLVELLVVIGIIGILIALALPAVQRARKSAAKAQCLNNMKHLALAVHAYHDAEKRFPYNQYGDVYGIGPDSRAWSWLARILPFVEQANVYREGDIPNKTLRNSYVADRQIPTFLCPSDPYSNSGQKWDAGNLPDFPVGQTNYKGVSGANWGDDLEGDAGPDYFTFWRNVGTNGSYDGHSKGDGIFYRTDYRRRLRLENIADGASYTFMIGEDLPAVTRYCSWPYANNANGTCAIPPNAKAPGGYVFPLGNWENNESFRSNHWGGLHFAFADGSVQFINDTIPLATYRALATIGGREAASPP